MADQTVGKTILAQLGGGRFVAMTGARQLTSHPDGLSFRIPMKTRDGSNYVRVTLTPADTYTVTFTRIFGRLCSPRSEHTDVYAEDLQPLFTRVTGLETSLGTMGRRP